MFATVWSCQPGVSKLHSGLESSYIQQKKIFSLLVKLNPEICPNADDADVKDNFHGILFFDVFCFRLIPFV